MSVVLISRLYSHKIQVWYRYDVPRAILRYCFWINSHMARLSCLRTHSNHWGAQAYLSFQKSRDQNCINYHTFSTSALPTEKVKYCGMPNVTRKDNSKVATAKVEPQLSQLCRQDTSKLSPEIILNINTINIVIIVLLVFICFRPQRSITVIQTQGNIRNSPLCIRNTAHELFFFLVCEARDSKQCFATELCAEL